MSSNSGTSNVTLPLSQSSIKATNNKYENYPLDFNKNINNNNKNWNIL